MEQLVTIELFGQPYTFKTQSEMSRAKEVADYLVNEVTRVESQQLNGSKGLNRETIMILAALNIARDCLELKRDRTNIMSEISDRSLALIRKLDLCCLQFNGNNSYKLQSGI